MCLRFHIYTYSAKDEEKEDDEGKKNNFQVVCVCGCVGVRGMMEFCINMYAEMITRSQRIKCRLWSVCRCDYDNCKSVVCMQNTHLFAGRFSEWRDLDQLQHVTKQIMWDKG